MLLGPFLKKAFGVLIQLQIILMRSGKGLEDRWTNVLT